MIHVYLFGGVGNQLFQIARALQHKLDGRAVTLVDCAPYGPIVSRVLGWTLQKDWLGIDQFCGSLDLKVRPAMAIDLLMLAALKLLKRFNGVFDRRSTRACFGFAMDVGYFQSVSKVSSRSAVIVAQSLRSFLDIHRQGHGRAVIHFRASDFAEEDRISTEAFGQFAAGQKVFWVSDDQASMPQDDRYQLYDGGSPLEDFRFIAGCEKLLITRSTFGLWAALVAKQLGPAEVKVHQFADWENYLNCPAS